MIDPNAAQRINAYGGNIAPRAPMPNAVQPTQPMHPVNKFFQGYGNLLSDITGNPGTPITQNLRKLGNLHKDLGDSYVGSTITNAIHKIGVPMAGRFVGGGIGGLIGGPMGANIGSHLGMMGGSALSGAMFGSGDPYEDAKQNAKYSALVSGAQLAGPAVFNAIKNIAPRLGPAFNVLRGGSHLNEEHARRAYFVPEGFESPNFYQGSPYAKNMGRGNIQLGLNNFRLPNADTAPGGWNNIPGVLQAFKPYQTYMLNNLQVRPQGWHPYWNNPAIGPGNVLGGS